MEKTRKRFTREEIWEKVDRAGEELVRKDEKIAHLEHENAVLKTRLENIARAVWTERYARKRLIPMFDGQPTWPQEKAEEALIKLDALLPDPPTIKWIRGNIGPR